MPKHEMTLGEADASALMALIAMADVLADMAVALRRAGLDPDEFLTDLEVNAVKRMERHLVDKGLRPHPIHAEAIKHIANAVHQARLRAEGSQHLDG
ncbi:hypothetical protein [Aureimonas sp. AU12]|uniref:hypothetical protein n=1 Tax=Aureimonas sp. AU12 TaxID=1638161 RepID=UPI00078492EA|nr:hypothetical protein [Aureimonas sp. AU12]